MDCVHQWRAEWTAYHPGGTALRLDVSEPAPRCMLLLTSTARQRNISPARWWGSGGSLLTICEPCSRAMCPLDVEAEGGLMSNDKRGPCPVCRRFNRREGYGEVECKECKLLYRLIK